MGENRERVPQPSTCQGFQNTYGKLSVFVHSELTLTGSDHKMLVSITKDEGGLSAGSLLILFRLPEEYAH